LATEHAPDFVAILLPKVTANEICTYYGHL